MIIKKPTFFLLKSLCCFQLLCLIATLWVFISFYLDMSTFTLRYKVRLENEAVERNRGQGGGGRRGCLFIHNRDSLSANVILEQT